MDWDSGLCHLSTTVVTQWQEVHWGLLQLITQESYWRHHRLDSLSPNPITSVHWSFLAMSNLSFQLSNGCPYLCCIKIWESPGRKGLWRLGIKRKAELPLLLTVNSWSSNLNQCAHIPVEMPAVHYKEKKISVANFGILASHCFRFSFPCIWEPSSSFYLP